MKVFCVVLIQVVTLAVEAELDGDLELFGACLPEFNCPVDPPKLLPQSFTASWTYYEETLAEMDLVSVI